MKPPPFEYHAPASLEEALALLDQFAPQDVKVLAGGQSLMPMLNLRLVRPGHVVDINRLTGLDYIRAQNGQVAIGALTRERTLERSAELGGRLPLFQEAVSLIGDRSVRYRGTIGGSLAHADPAAELPVLALALQATVTLASVAGNRTLPVQELCAGPLMTTLEPNELLVEVRLPPLSANAGCAFLELARQHGAFAIVAVAAVIVLDGAAIADAWLAIGGAAPTPIRARQAEAFLQGREPSPEALEEAGRLAASETDPSSDVHGSADYRREMAAVYTRRALEVALQRVPRPAAERLGAT